MLKFFNYKWIDVPTVWIDTETTGINPNIDKAVQLAIVRFENGTPVKKYSTYINPKREIPSEISLIHNIKNEDIINSPTIEDVFNDKDVISIFNDAQLGAYNGNFDKHFIPVIEQYDLHWLDSLTLIKHISQYDWPWLDSLILVRYLDKYVRGSGRHKLKNVCERYNIPLDIAHDASYDAIAAGMIFYKLMPLFLKEKRYVCPSMGLVLKMLGELEKIQWYEYWKWKTGDGMIVEELIKKYPYICKYTHDGLGKGSYFNCTSKEEAEKIKEELLSNTIDRGFKILSVEVTETSYKDAKEYLKWVKNQEGYVKNGWGYYIKKYEDK